MFDFLKKKKLEKLEEEKRRKEEEERRRRQQQPSYTPEPGYLGYDPTPFDPFDVIPSFDPGPSPDPCGSSGGFDGGGGCSSSE